MRFSCKASSENTTKGNDRRYHGHRNRLSAVDSFTNIGIQLSELIEENKEMKNIVTKLLSNQANLKPWQSS